MQALAKLAAERAKFGFFEILMLVLTSGAIGAGLIFYHDRLRRGWQQSSGMKEDATPQYRMLCRRPRCR